MKFQINIEYKNNPFYSACKMNGQAMGMATPFVLQNTGLFDIVYKENGKPSVVDKNNKTYQTHHSKGNKFFINPSYQKGFGRQFQKQQAHAHICSSDFHLFTNLKDDVLHCVVIPTYEVLALVDKESGEVCVEF